MEGVMARVREHIKEGLEEARKFTNTLKTDYGMKNEYGVDLNFAAKAISEHKIMNKQIEIVDINLSAIKNNKIGEISGKTTFYKDKVFIIVNSKDIPYRKRFTVAHELAHIYFGDVSEKSNIHFRANVNKESVGEDYFKKEQRANAFASELLMPTEQVKNLMYERKSIESMAVAFGVSYSAMKNKISSILGYSYG